MRTSESTQGTRPIVSAMLSLLLICLAPLTSRAQASGTGTIQGRVLNAATGKYLNNAHVTVPGTDIEAYTNDTGGYWLANVPAGDVTVQVRMVGLDQQAATVSVAAGQVAVRDFELGSLTSAEGNVVKLDPYSVEARAISGAAVAMTEQKNAANIKNVISLDEFVDMADGNLGEFLKFVPGVDIEYNPFYPTSAGIRGMPATGTLIQYDGVTLAAPSVAGNRTFDLTTAANANVDRLEVSKVPTPDMPANAVGGSINVISKSGFTRKDPQLSYSIYGTYSARRGEFDPKIDKVPGPDGKSTLRPVQPAYELSYLIPIKNKFAFALGLTRTPRVQEAEFLQPTWQLSTTAQPLVANQTMSEYMSAQVADTARVGFDWKIGDYGTLQASWLQTNREGIRRYSRVQWVTNAAGRTGDYNSTSGRGDLRQLQDWQTQIRELQAMSVIYRYDGPLWKADASVAYSTGKYSNNDVGDGSFAVLNATTPANSIDWVVVGHQAIQDNPGRIPEITGKYVSGGAAVDPFDGSQLGINSVTSNDDLLYETTNKSLGVNVSREFNFKIPTTFKVGIYYEESDRDGVTANKTYNFRPNGSSAFADRLASNFDVLVSQGYIDRQSFTNVDGQHMHTKFISLAKLYDLYVQHPTWFVLDETGAYTARVNGSQAITETIAASYIRMDNRFMDNRLRITSGFRYERTEDDGTGPLNDIAATYQRNPDGSFVRNSSGALVPITTNALEKAKLQYTERGASKKTNYDGWYPSINASYNIGESFVLRAAYARTIGRPDLDEIIPSTTVTDPNAVNTSSGALGSLTVVDGDLKPWSADNYDLTFETYDFKGATASVSLFQKDVQNFFTTREEDATPEILQEVGLPSNFVGYRVIRKVNSGTARIRGVELSYSQSLSFLPGNWGRRIQVFGNLTNQNISGPNAADFARVAEKMFRGGIGYVHPRFVVKLNVSREDYLKLGGASGGAFTFLGPSTRWDFSTQVRVHKRLSVFFSVRNLTAEPQERSVLNFNTINPRYSEPRDWRYLPATYSFGVKGTY